MLIVFAGIIGVMLVPAALVTAYVVLCDEAPDH